MKQLFYLIALCCLLTSTPAMACVMCDDNNTEQTCKRQRGGRQQMDPAKMAEARVKQMTKKYHTIINNVDPNLGIFSEYKDLIDNLFFKKHLTRFLRMLKLF